MWIKLQCAYEQTSKNHPFKNPAKRVSTAQQKQHTDVRREKQVTVMAHSHMQIVAIFPMGLPLSDPTLMN